MMAGQLVVLKVAQTAVLSVVEKAERWAAWMVAKLAERWAEQMVVERAEKKVVEMVEMWAVCSAGRKAVRSAVYWAE